tara:strand:- start:128 stop:457 length:330 start_codon:yes stop_codon:yes gene_type:complete
MKDLKVVRLNLEVKAYEALDKMVSELNKEESFCQISKSDLTSEIITSFFETKFQREKSRLAEKYFNSKKFLKSALREATDAQLDRMLREVLKKRTKPKKPIQKSPEDQS